jgi:hypothetical protein
VILAEIIRVIRHKLRTLAPPPACRVLLEANITEILDYGKKTVPENHAATRLFPFIFAKILINPESILPGGSYRNE